MFDEEREEEKIAELPQHQREEWQPDGMSAPVEEKPAPLPSPFTGSRCQRLDGGGYAHVNDRPGGMTYFCLSVYGGRLSGSTSLDLHPDDAEHIASMLLDAARVARRTA